MPLCTTCKPERGSPPQLPLQGTLQAAQPRRFIKLFAAGRALTGAPDDQGDVVTATLEHRLILYCRIID
jgi:hypothetical protein